ncbi:hypothetical protein J5N97_003800 [Dioscorea zingiberensis]|uniref:Retrotransposon gag domain-containing protein n=1 Tax=Dioscorea zingiberensis TaxID=325984 RepID=A0A9D5HQS7_9LILI|nr:hypothetical protein J5N97_003800 [Dioscorea zingiberensis]
MMVNRTSEVVLCHGFPKTLTRIVYDWFRSLPHGSIAYFDQLADQFLRLFANCMREKRNPVMLLRCKQREGESLRDYLDRFKKETYGMSHLDSIMVVGAAMDGRREYSFLEAISRDVPRDLPELMNRVQKYIASNEFKAGRREQAIQRANEFRKEEPRQDGYGGPRRGERGPRREADRDHDKPPRQDGREAREINRPRIRPRIVHSTTIRKLFAACTTWVCHI